MNTIAIPRAIHDAMIAHSAEERPSECCGFLTGRGTIENVVRLRNASASPVTYSVNAQELLQVNRELRDAGLDVLAIYHSHPTGAAVPSPTDLVQNGYGETVPHVIIGWIGEVPEVRAWLLRETSYREVAMEIV